MPRNRGRLFFCEVAALGLCGKPRADAGARLPHDHLSTPPSRSAYLLEQPDNFAQFLQLLLVICCLSRCLPHGLSPSLAYEE